MSGDKYFTFGYRRFGPFLYGFVRWLKGELLRKGYDRVFFFSRDGYMMKKAFDLINDAGIKSEYVYVSRRSLRTPLLHRARSFEDSLRYLSRERYISLGKLLEYYGYDEAERQAIADKNGFRLEEAIPFDKLTASSRARRIWNENRDIIISRSAEQNRLLMQYISDLGMGGRAAIADIGWYGNMQSCLEELLRLNSVSGGTEGFYIGIRPKAEMKASVNGYLFSDENDRNTRRVLCFFGGYEKLLQSAEGSTAGYTEENGRAVPRLMPYEYEDNKEIISAVKSWQEGALCFVKKAHKAKLSASDEQLTEPLIRFGMSPSVKETKLFEFFYNTEGTRIWFLPQKPLYRYRPAELKQALAESPWKTGFMRSLFKVPGPYYLIYRLLKK